MTKKVAIYCPTKEDWQAIDKFVNLEIHERVYDKYYGNQTCVSFEEENVWNYADKAWYEGEGYEVITAKEYLKSRTSVSTTETNNAESVNPKAQIGSYALPMGMISPLFSAHVALGKLNGAEKYGLANYIGTEVVMSIYLDAIQRHLDKIKMGEEVDDVDGVNHFGAIGANCDIILSAQAAGTLIDDRPLSTGQLEAYKALTPMVKQLKELHKEKQPLNYYMRDYEYKVK